MYQTFKELINQISSENKELLAYQWFNQEHLCQKTYDEFKGDMLQFLDILEKDSPKRCHIGVVGPNSYGWVLSYMSIMYSNHVIIPVDRELPLQALIDIINMGDIDTLVVIGEMKQILELSKDQLQVRRFIYVSAHEQTVSITAETIHPKINHSLKDTPDIVKKIIFTSGTTGVSKGVMLREASILEDVHAFALVFEMKPYKTTYNLLPMHHMYAAVGDLLCAIQFKNTLAINTNPRKIADELKVFKPYSLKIVPLIADSFMRMAELSVKNQQLASINDYFGGELDYILCSGAIVPERLIERYEAAGIAVQRGYGLTEATAGVTFTGMDMRNQNLITVGTPVACNKVRIRNNEIQVKGNNIMVGYYKNPEATAAAFDGEWLKTGDLGYLEGDFLYITGRSKNIIILSNGKNIYPEEIEEYFAALPDVDEIFVFEGNLSNGEQVLTAGIYSANKNEEAIVKAIEDINQSLPSYKQLHKILFTSKPLDKTTTRKIKRENSKKQIIHENTFLKIKELLSQVIYLDDIQESSHLLLDLGLDSFSILDFIDKCENCYNIAIDTNELRNFKTVGDIVNFINDKSNYCIAQ